MNYVEKLNICNSICQTFSRTLINPQNLFSIDNPDVLVSENNCVYAIYIPTYDELQNLDHLLRRLYVSQLSYSSYFIPILLAGKLYYKDEKDTAFLQLSFSHISTSIDDTVTYIKLGKRKEIKKWKQLGHCKQNNILEYKNNLEFSTIFDAKTSGKFIDYFSTYSTLAHPVYSWKRDAKYLPPKVMMTQYGILFSRDNNKGTFKKLFQPIMTYLMLSRYVLDNGLIYYIRCDDEHIPMNVINSCWGNGKNEIYPNRYRRTLSFLGGVPILLNDEISIDMLYKDYFCFISRKNETF